MSRACLWTYKKMPQLSGFWKNEESRKLASLGLLDSLGHQRAMMGVMLFLWFLHLFMWPKNQGQVVNMLVLSKHNAFSETHKEASPSFLWLELLSGPLITCCFSVCLPMTLALIILSINVLPKRTVLISALLKFSTWCFSTWWSSRQFWFCFLQGCTWDLANGTNFQKAVKHLPSHRNLNHFEFISVYLYLGKYQMKALYEEIVIPQFNPT